jgi:ubiquinone/menaquinone biosynthesis C-methylase UbiE
MTTPIAEPARTYVLDGSEADLQRLTKVAALAAEPLTASLRRIGIVEGWKAIDCGCGPIGGLATMADLVGPRGRVVGIDFNESAVIRARASIAALDLRNVDVVVGDVHDADAAALGGPFDVAFMRCFLTHQPDPVGTLSCVRRLVRPGGWVIAHEPLRTPAPRSHPHLDALEVGWELVQRVAEAAGVQAECVAELPNSARQAGLELVDVEGYFKTMPPDVGFELTAVTVEAAKTRAIESGVTTLTDVDRLVQTLRSAKNGGYQWVSTPFLLHLTMRVPASS